MTALFSLSYIFFSYSCVLFLPFVFQITDSIADKDDALARTETSYKEELKKIKEIHSLEIEVLQNQSITQLTDLSEKVAAVENSLQAEILKSSSLLEDLSQAQQVRS